MKRSGAAPRHKAYPQHTGSDSEKMTKYMSERPDYGVSPAVPATLARNSNDIRLLCFACTGGELAL